MNHMERAISLAQGALGFTSPNPAVGAVLVKDGIEIGEGATLPPGQSHAEIVALQQAGEASSGATLYTTLEPCSTYGRTPPCTKSIIEAGVVRVHVAAIDPNPNVSGAGCAELRSHGLEVVVEEDVAGAAELYEGFAKHVNTGIPFVTAKFAMSLDGKIATRTGDSKWVTGEESRAWVQQMGRETDAILVGVNTVLADNPQLTARDAQSAPFARQPLRVILDSNCRTPSDANLLRQPGDTLIATTHSVPESDFIPLERAGAEILALPPDGNRRVSIAALLEELGRRGVVNLLVESGGTVLGSMFDAGLVDKVYAYIAPVIIGGAEAFSPIEGKGVESMAQAWWIDRLALRPSGADWLIIGYPAKRT